MKNINLNLCNNINTIQSINQFWYDDKYTHTHTDIEWRRKVVVVEFRWLFFVLLSKNIRFRKLINIAVVEMFTWLVVKWWMFGGWRRRRKKSQKKVKFEIQWEKKWRIFSQKREKSRIKRKWYGSESWKVISFSIFRML